MLPPLIITAKMDALSFDIFDELRRRHFPPERNFLSAHITLFHHLPGEQISIVENDLKNTVSGYAKISLNFSSVRFLGRGTAIEIDAPELVVLRANLAAKWREFLTPQDRQKFKPHITVQNKTEPDAAKILYEKLKVGWQNRMGDAIGLQLWHYLGGPWRLGEEFGFNTGEK